MAAFVRLPHDTPPDTVLRQYLSTTTCTLAMQACTGPHAQFGSMDACMAFAQTAAVGGTFNFGADSLLCRSMHAPLAALRPAVHCPALGRSGGEWCRDRDYREVVRAEHFPRGWIAPTRLPPDFTWYTEIGELRCNGKQDL
jgi:hypothetical protein